MIGKHWYDTVTIRNVMQFVDISGFVLCLPHKLSSLNDFLVNTGAV